MTIDEIVQKTATKYGLDPKILARQIQVESGGNPRAVSPKGARGLMQIMPETGKSLGLKNFEDPEQNVDAGARLMQQLLDRYNGDYNLALAAYNSNPNAVDSAGGKIPNIPETQNYVKNIMQSNQEGVDPKSGYRIYEGTYNGKKLRIQVPNGTPQNQIEPLFSAEFNRQEKDKGRAAAAVQPIGRGDPYEFGSETISAIPGAIGRALNPKNLYSGPMGTGFGAGDEVTPESLQRGMSGEDIPIVGSAIRALKGKFTPDEAADWAVSMGQAGLGGAASRGLGITDAAQIGQGIQRGVKEASQTRAPIWRASVPGLAGMGVGHLLGYSPYESGIVGAVAGSKGPAFARGFLRGAKEPFDVSKPIDIVHGQPTDYNPYQDIPRQWAGHQLENVVDARTSPAYQPAGASPGVSGIQPPTPRQLPAGQNPGVIEMQPSTGPALPQGPARVFQMPQAHQVPIYGGKPGLVRSSESGMYVPRQGKLPLYQEGANIPGQPAPTPEEIGQKLVPSIRRQQMVSTAKGAEQPQPTVTQLENAEKPPVTKMAEVKEMPKQSSQIITTNAVKEYARVHGIDETQAKKFFEDKGYEIKTGKYFRRKKKTD